ncbi:MAG TPA: 4-alpha-glucanotransferase [Candidatus Limnocylindrales bacterium]|nr:4-alpha-glucanotransferase [Candidatus Limnocylindrales bacterium]
MVERTASSRDDDDAGAQLLTSGALSTGCGRGLCAPRMQGVLRRPESARRGLAIETRPAILRAMAGGDAQNLDALAAALGVTRSYHDGTGQFRRACDEAVLAVVRALGAPVERIEDAGEALRAVEDRHARPSMPAVAAIAERSGGVVQFPALRESAGGARANATLVLESGESQPLRIAGAAAQIPRETPVGLHHVDVEHGSDRLRTNVLVFPAHLPEIARSWCVFAPLYALRVDGKVLSTYGDLAKLSEWVAGGAKRSSRHRDTTLVGTLPLLACFFEEPFEPSPYSPISRSFWSEVYVDPSASPEAVAGRSAAPIAGASATPCAAPFRADYRRAMRERRHELEALLVALDSRGGVRREAFERLLEEDGELATYASFRAAVELYGTTWERWPARAQAGMLRAGVDYDGEVFRYHAYAQWLAREQLERAASQSPAGLYLDLPLGSHPGGYDTWRYKEDFACGVSVGAPPDAVFAGGQDWGFPPLHPERARRGGYAALRAALRHHFAHASLVRVDHVMGLHRSFWIPNGFSAADGVYVRSPKDELWALLAIAAAQARGGRGAAVVGEDLGTVPDEVRDEMRTRGALRMHVVPFECHGDHCAPIVPAPRDTLACLGTHDMEPFASWWDAPSTRRDEIAAGLGCEATAAAVLPRLLSWLAAGDATVSCVNLEDLWLERERQNLPGSPAGDQSWQRQFARDFDDFARDPRIRELLDVARGAADPVREQAA